jgi:hypothetical protein
VNGRDTIVHLPALTSRAADHSTIRNTCLVVSDARAFGPRDTGCAMREEDDKTKDRRYVQRTKVLRGAKIILPSQSPVIHCTVQNLTDGGACLKVANTYGVPQTFELTFEHGRTRRACRVVWRTSDELGVSFEKEKTAAAS